MKLLEDLRDQIEKLKKTHFESYEKIIQKLNNFTEEHSTIINELLSYVKFLNGKDEIALNMLYYWDIWRSDKNDVVSQDNKTKSHKRTLNLMNIVLNLL